MHWWWRRTGRPGLLTCSLPRRDWSRCSRWWRGASGFNRAMFLLKPLAERRRLQVSRMRPRNRCSPRQRLMRGLRPGDLRRNPGELAIGASGFNRAIFLLKPLAERRRLEVSPMRPRNRCSPRQRLMRGLRPGDQQRKPSELAIGARRRDARLRTGSRPGRRHHLLRVAAHVPPRGPGRAGYRPRVSVPWWAGLGELGRAFPGPDLPHLRKIKALSGSANDFLQ